MVPTIYPLETLHNALSLRQVSEFLSRVCQRHTDAQVQPSADSSGPSSTVSSAGPSSPTAVDANCQFGFGDQYSLSSQVTEGSQGLRLPQECPGKGAQGLLIEGGQEPLQPNQCPQEPPADTSRPGQDIPEEDSQLCQHMPDISPRYPENQDNVKPLVQEAPQGSLSRQKVSREACTLCQKSFLGLSQPCQGGTVGAGRFVSSFPEGASSLTQETLQEVVKPTPKIPKKSSQPCSELPLGVGRLAHEVSVMVLSQDTPHGEKPPQESPEEGEPQVHAVSEERHLPLRAVPEVNDPLPAQRVPQDQRLSSDSGPQSQSPAHDQQPPFPPAARE